MPSATLTSKGQITLPKPVRDRLNLRPGDRVGVVINEEGEIRVRTSRHDVRDLKGLLHRRGRKPVTLEQMDAVVARGGARR